MNELLKSFPPAFGIDLKIYKGGAIIVATVSAKTAEFIPYSLCAHLPIWNNGVASLGNLDRASTNLTWEDLKSQLLKLPDEFDLYVETRNGSEGPLTSGLFLIFK